MSVKATFVLDDMVLQEARECVRENRFKSLSAFVERSIRNELNALKQEKIRSSIKKAASDPLFMADMMEIQNDFSHTDFEGEGL